VSEHAVDGDIYAAAQEVFSDQGLVEMLMLIGCYLSVCALLNAFSVPVPDVRPTRHEEDAR
jgi:4-carboxymuconolactone decarboxylase